MYNKNLKNSSFNSIDFKVIHTNTSIYLNLTIIQININPFSAGITSYKYL